MNTVYLVRHGENPANLNRQFSYKKIDHSLTPTGVIQAQQTAAYFRDKHIDEIYSSPLKRAYETAAIIGRELGLPVTVIEGFREINVGALEDGPHDADAWAFHDRIIHDWRHGTPETRFPGGEDYFTLVDRVRAGIEAVVRGKRGRHIVIVAHGGVMVAALHKLCPDADSAGLNLRLANCAISRFAFGLQGGVLQGRLLEWASCAHLAPAPDGHVPALLPSPPA